MLSQKTMMALRPKGPLVARTTILTKHQGQQQEHHPPRGGQPGPRAQPHALFFSRGGKQKKIEVHKMSASAKMCLRPSPEADFWGGSFQRGKNVAPTATRTLFWKGHKGASEAFLKNVNGTPTGSRFLRKSRARLSHSKIFGAKRGLQQPKPALGTNRFSGAKRWFSGFACQNIGFCCTGEKGASSRCQQ